MHLIVQKHKKKRKIGTNSYSGHFLLCYTAAAFCELEFIHRDDKVMYKREYTMINEMKKKLTRDLPGDFT